MAATFNESQKIDYLWKKVGYGVTKTAEVTSKEAFNESIASPLLYRGDLVWMESDKISGTPPAATSSIIQVYKDGVGSYSPSVECTEDLTAPDNQTWKTNLTNWVPTQFGDNYLIQVYVANSGVTNPQTSGTKLFQAGSGNDDTWFFDYQSGVLNFNGSNIPTQITGGITGKSVYIVGYRYVGLIGVTNQPSGNIASNTNIGNLNFTDTTISTITPNSNIYLAPNGVGNVLISTSLTSNGNFTVNGISNLGNVGNVKITGGTTGYLLQTDGNGNLSWFQPSSGSSIANGNSNVSIPNIDGNINLTAVGNTTMVIAGNGVNIQGYLTVTGTVTAGNINANVSSDTVTANSANISGNLYVADTATIGNVRTDHILYANGQPWDLQEAAGANTQIQYNDGNTNFGASANFTFDYTTNLLTVVGNANVGNFNATGTINATGNISGGNITTIGEVVATGNGTFNNIATVGSGGNITGANVVSANTFTASANINANNANLGNLVTANYANISANLYVVDTALIGNVRTDHILYANGSPWDLQEAAGSNTEIQFNDGNTNFGASANFTFNTSTNLLTVIGDTQFNNANLGNLATANYVNVSYHLDGNTANFTGNIITLNTDAGNLLLANFASISGDLITSNATINLELQANTANFDGNVQMDQWLTVADTANVGNLRTDHILYANGMPWDLQEAAGANTQIQYNDGNTNFGASANFTFDYTTNLLTVVGTANISNLNISDAITSNFANISGNLYVADTALIGNVRTDHILYANGSPWDLQEAAGFVNQIQYNDGNTNFGASANFTYNDNTQLFTVAGNISASNAGLGNLASANYINILANLSVADTANVGVLRTDYLLYANGQPWDLQEAAGANTYIQYNDGNTNFGASANFTYNDSTQLLTIIGNASVTNFNASGTVNVTGNISADNANLGNLTTSNYFHGVFDVTSSSQPNITSLGNLTSLTVGNATSNVVLLDGNINATGNINANNVNGNFTGTFTGNVNGNITGIGSNTQVLFNYDGDVNGSNAFIFDYAANILILTGTGNITGNLNVSSNVTAANGVFGNISTTGVAGDITGANLISTVTLTASGNITAGNANLGNTSIANNVIANTFRMGVGVNEFYHSTVYFATTTSTDPNQVLWSTSMANLSAIDFTIISTDETSNTRQTAKIAAAVLGTDVVFNEYSGLYINGGVGSFSVNYQAGPPETIQLVVTPDSTNLTKYNMMIIQYAK